MASDWEEKKSITEVELAHSSAKPGFMLVIAQVPSTFEQNDEAWKEMYLVKFQLGNLSGAQRT